MRLSEKNVLIGTGILFLIVFGMLNIGNIKSAEQLEERPSIEITSSSYNVNDGKLTLEFEKPIKEFELSRITVIDEQNNSFSGESKPKSDFLIFDTYIPQLNSGDILKIVIEEATSTKELKIEYKIPENMIIST
jgi:hypothetical protein